MNIKPIAQLTIPEICQLAQAAADRGEDDANPFEQGSRGWRVFDSAYTDRACELQAA